jgi:3-hydroxyisobutyrate dehydrogenase-like beta-hydroxyacid dehydrogenase
MTAMLPTVGWIGLGNIGAPMAQRVLEAGYPLRVWARKRHAAQVLVDRGAASSSSPEALAQQSDVLVTIVGGPDDVLEVHRKLLANARTDTPVLEMSTASPATATALQALAEPAHARVLDCPVTGGVAGARQGKLTSFVGGDADVLARCRPLLAALSHRIVHCGGPGAGYRMKLVNQTMIAGVLLGLAEGSALARNAGFDAALVKEALGEGTAAGVLFHSYLARMIDVGGDVTFTLGMFAKDLRLAREEAMRSSASAPLLDCAIGAVDRACARFGAQAGVQTLAAAELR